MKRNFFKFLSYVAAFTYGAYTYAALHGNCPKASSWILTGFFGTMFYIMSLSEEE